MALSFSCFAQDTRIASHTIAISAPAVALIDLEGTTSISLSPAAPTEAGLPLNFTNSTNNGIWVNVSSVVGAVTKTSRDVSAQITSGTIPAGLALRVVSANDVAQGEGLMGTPASQITLSGSSQNLITGFGTCYTGDGISKGYRLTYSLVLANYANVRFDNGATVTITYTISD